MVDYVSDSLELARRVRAHSFSPDVDRELADKLQRIPGVTADLLSESAEILYAYYDRLNDEGRRLLAELWTYANEQHWTTFVGGAYGSDNKAERIIKALRHELGELKGKATKPADMPAPQTSRRDGRDWRDPEGTLSPAEPAVRAPPPPVPVPVAEEPAREAPQKE